MSALMKLINDWKETDEKRDFRDLFKNILHKTPFYLRYSLDSSRPNLFLIHMTDYSDRTNEVVQECNGIILNNEDYSIIAYGMNRMVDQTENFLARKFTPDWDNSVLEEAEDGAVLTVFNHGGTWVVSTKRNIDAHNVKWSSSKSFYELLSDAIPGGNLTETFDRDLDKDYTYSFVLLHPENHLVINHREPKLIYVSRRNLKTLQEDNVSSMQNVSSFPWAQKRETLSKETAMQRMSDTKRTNRRGIILCRKNGSTIDREMIDYRWFAEANQLRKGLPSLHLSYLACSPEERQKLRKYFGNLQDFNVIDALLRDLTRYTFDVYKNSYIRKQYRVDYNHPIYKTVRNLHNTYKLTREPVRIHHVIDEIDNIPTHVIDKMLWYFYNNGFQVPAAAEDGQPEQQQPEQQQPEQQQQQQQEQPQQQQQQTDGDVRIDDDEGVKNEKDEENKEDEEREGSVSSTTVNVGDKKDE